MPTRYKYLSLTTLLGAALFFNACTPNKPSEKIAVMESVDSTAMADTSIENSAEHSYEYFQSFIVSKTLVYDLVGFLNKNGEREFAIMRRGVDNVPDTLVKGTFTGDIKNAWLCDINRNGDKEIMFYTKTPVIKGESKSAFVGYELGKKGPSKIELEFNGQPCDTMYLQRDTVVNVCPLEGDNDKYPQAKFRKYFKLVNGKLESKRYNVMMNGNS